MILVLRLLPQSKCEGCGAIGRVHDLTGLCLSCLAPWIHVEERKEKLDSTLRVKFAWPVEKIQEFKRAFQR
jgi:hypothetical protein